MTPQEEITDLKTRLAALEAKLDAQTDTGVWVPEKGEKYWFIYSDGTVNYDFWIESAVDKGRISVSNVYKTEAEALEHAAKRKAYVAVVRKLREIAGGFVPDWDDSMQKKWFVYRDGPLKEWKASSTYSGMSMSKIFFPNKGTADRALALGDELNALLYDGVVR